MPDRRKHRGPHPEDGRLFAPDVLPRLRAAAGDLAWLLSRGYAPNSSLKLVGDRYALVARQRVAVARSVCSAATARGRAAKEVSPSAMAGEALWVDGYNVLTTVEAALAGGVVLAAYDGTFRDMASMHGSFRKVAETLPALDILGRVIAEMRPGRCMWLLDRPVSNSGRLRALMEKTAARHGWSWQVELVADPDAVLADLGADPVVATADSAVLDRCPRWVNLARLAVERWVPEAWVIEFSAEHFTFVTNVRKIQ